MCNISVVCIDVGIASITDIFRLGSNIINIFWVNIDMINIFGFDKCNTINGFRFNTNMHVINIFGIMNTVMRIMLRMGTARIVVFVTLCVNQ